MSSFDNGFDELERHVASAEEQNNKKNYYDGLDRILDIIKNTKNSWVSTLTNWEMESKSDNKEYQDLSKRYNFWNKKNHNLINNKKFEEIRFSFGKSGLMLFKGVSPGYVTQIPISIIAHSYFGFSEEDDNLKSITLKWDNNENTWPFFENFLIFKEPKIAFLEMYREELGGPWMIRTTSDSNFYKEPNITWSTQKPILEDVKIHLLSWGDEATSLKSLNEHSYMSLLKSLQVVMSRKTKEGQVVGSVIGNSKNVEDYDRQMDKVATRDGVLEPTYRNVINASESGGGFSEFQKNTSALANDMPAFADYLTQVVMYERMSPIIGLIYASSTEKTTSAQMAIFMEKDLKIKELQGIKSTFILKVFKSWMELSRNGNLDEYNISEEFRVSYPLSLNIDNLNPQLTANVKQAAVATLGIGPTTNVSQAVDEATKAIEKKENKEQGGIENGSIDSK